MNLVQTADKRDDGWDREWPKNKVSVLCQYVGIILITKQQQRLGWKGGLYISRNYVLSIDMGDCIV